MAGERFDDLNDLLCQIQKVARAKDPAMGAVWKPLRVRGEIRYGTDTPLWRTPEEIEHLKETST